VATKSEQFTADETGDQFLFAMTGACGMGKWEKESVAPVLVSEPASFLSESPGTY